MPNDPRRQREKPQQVADAIRSLIVSGQVRDGELLGRQADLVERFGVSLPSLREALRILEAERLVSVVRGASGGIFARTPDERITARTAALVLQSRNVSLADVFKTRRHLEPLAARRAAQSPQRRTFAAELSAIADQQDDCVAVAAAFAPVNLHFHERLMTMAGNHTLAIVAGTLNEILAQSIAALRRDEDSNGSIAGRRRTVRSQRRLVALIEAGDAAGAEQHWRAHMGAVGRIVLGDDAEAVVDLIDHD